MKFTDFSLLSFKNPSTIQDWTRVPKSTQTDDTSESVWAPVKISETLLWKFVFAPFVPTVKIKVDSGCKRRSSLQTLCDESVLISSNVKTQQSTRSISAPQTPSISRIKRLQMKYGDVKPEEDSDLKHQPLCSGWDLTDWCKICNQVWGF